MAVEKLIRARLKGTEPRNGEIKKFKSMKELPIPGTAVGDGNCYGGSYKLEMSIYQNTRDESLFHLYDFYKVDVLNARLLKCCDEYICIPHEPSSVIPAFLYDELVKMAQDYDDEKKYVHAALALKSWESYDVNKKGRDGWLQQLFVAVHRTIPEIIDECGLSQIRFAKTFAIPRRTVENWCHITPPPVYVSLMLQECLGLYTRE